MGYANRTIKIDFPDLTEQDDTGAFLDDLIFVTIRNPRTVPLDGLVPDEADGEDVRREAVYKILANLIVDWHVYDGTSDDPADPPMPKEFTTDAIAKLPMEILNKLSEEIGRVTPTPR